MPTGAACPSWATRAKRSCGRRTRSSAIYVDVLPAGIDVEQMDRDAAIPDLLLPVHQQLTQILTMVNDTITVAGSDLMKACTSCTGR